MTGNDKLFSYEYNGETHYVHASDLTQAAIMFKEKLNLNYVCPFNVRLAKPLNVYRAWYIKEGRTYYLYIVARSLKQAWYLFYDMFFEKPSGNSKARLKDKTITDFSHKNTFVEKPIKGSYSFGVYTEGSSIGKELAFYD